MFLFCLVHLFLSFLETALERATGNDKTSSVTCVCLFDCLLDYFLVCLFACVFVCLCACLFVCLLACLFVCLLVYLFVYFVFCLFVCLFARLL